MRLTAENKVATELLINNESVGFVDHITMRGLETIASCIGSPFNFKTAWMQFIGVGQGELGVSTEDFALESEKYRKIGNVWQVLNSYRVHARFGVSEPEAEYILREVGIFNGIAGMDMAARWVLDEDIYVAADDEVDITCIIWMV